MEFQKFGSLTRFSQGWTITEKIDGTNGQIALRLLENEDDQAEGAVALIPTTEGEMAIWAGSRNRWLSIEDDNYGFARWVQDNACELVKLGQGRHFGEWYGSGIQRGYGLKNGDKRFALFNVLKWGDENIRPNCCEVVEAFCVNKYMENPYMACDAVMALLKIKGSSHVKGYKNPEGVVMFHHKSNTLFKKTFDYDEQGKWAAKGDQS